MAMNLGFKISTVAAIPTISFIVAALVMINSNLHEKTEAVNTYENMQFVQASSNYIHEIQKERARSVAFLNGAATKEELDKQRDSTNSKSKPFYQELQQVSINHEYFSDAKKALENHENVVRRQIDNKELTAQEVIPKFNALVGELLKGELTIADNTRLPGVNEKIRSVNILEAAKESAGRLRANMTGIISANKPITDAQFQIVAGLKAGVTANLSSAGLVIAEESRKKIEAFRSTPHWQKVDWYFQLILKKADEGNFNEDSKEVIKVTTQQIDDIASVIIAELTSINSDISNTVSERTRSAWFILFMIIGLSAALLVFLFTIIRAITQPINRVIKDLRSSGSEVASASEQLQGVSQLLSSGAAEAAASLEETVASLSVLAEKVKLNAGHAKEASGLSQQSQDSAEQGESEIRRLITAMTDISQSSKKIEEIINVIDDIAFQTNLLALNAAVEAARAGEQGKGFSVVAEAVRNLAQRSASAAKEITVLIKDSVSQIENGSKIAGDSGTVLKNIVTSVKKVAVLNNEISVASQEQANGIVELNKAMNQLDQSTQSNAASAEEASASANEMSAQAVVMQDLVTELAVVVDGKDNRSKTGNLSAPDHDSKTQEDSQAKPKAA